MISTPIERQLDDEQHIQPLQEDRVDSKEVTRQDAGRLAV
jgi:hypothetical protein